MIIVVMGVCGCGKTLIGKMLAKQTGLAFYDADDFHSAKSVEKMTAGIALDDDDRLCWLKRLAGQMTKWQSSGPAVLACSALKKSYRKILNEAGEVRFVYLKASKNLIIQRMQNRKDHYMPVSLIDSQFAILEEPDDAMIVDAEKKPNEILRCILTGFRKKTGN
ncbi:MAG TPA: gluconokinase [Planctomycetes bacterium]|nr:gluconokinase [Planctomycetota bacterium]